MSLIKIIMALLTPFQWIGFLPVADSDLEKILDQDMCVEFMDEALNAGWPSHDLPRLFRIMHRESRCIPEACSVPDQPEKRRCRDWGLMQINDYSWRGTVKRMGFRMPDLHDPTVNLMFARWLYETSLSSNGCGWIPWNGSC